MTQSQYAMEKPFDKVADIYDETRRMPAGVIAGIMENITGEINPSDGLVLELGIGTGRIAIPMAERNFHIVGVDIAEKMVSRLRDNLATVPDRIHAVYGDVRALPLADDSFSAVIAVHVFHLLDDTNACIREARRVLSPGGRLLFGGEQRLLRYVGEVLSERYGVEEDIIAMLVDAGIRLPDQAKVERQAVDGIRRMGGDLKQLPPVAWNYEISCADIIARIEGRIASYLWGVPDDVMKSLVGKLRQRLATHVGPSSTMVLFRRKFSMYSARF